MVQSWETFILEFDIERRFKIPDENYLRVLTGFINNKSGGNHGAGPISYNNNIKINVNCWKTYNFESVFVNDSGLLLDFPIITCESISNFEFNCFQNLQKPEKQFQEERRQLPNFHINSPLCFAT